jgi:hypothetical protein
MPYFAIEPVPPFRNKDTTISSINKLTIPRQQQSNDGLTDAILRSDILILNR